LKEAVLRLESPVQTLSNLNIHVIGRNGQQVPGTLYAKVMGQVPGEGARYSVRFTSISPDIEAFLRTFLEAGPNPITPQKEVVRQLHA